MNRAIVRFSTFLLSLAVLGGLPVLAQGEKKKPTPIPTPCPVPNLPELIERLDGAEVNWTKGVILATGTGIAPERGSLGQRRALARRDAYQDAFQALSEALDPIRVTGDSALRDLLVGDDGLKLRLNELVHQAGVGEPKLFPDGSVEVTLSLPLYGPSSLASVALLPVKPPLATSSCVFSGVVVDARGCGAQPALLPQLKSPEGKVLFPNGIESAVFLAGPVKYFHSPDAAKNAMGKNPLVLRARLSSGSTHADLLLDEATVKQVLSAQGCLQSGALAFVL